MATFVEDLGEVLRGVVGSVADGEVEGFLALGLAHDYFEDSIIVISSFRNFER